MLCITTRYAYTRRGFFSHKAGLDLELRRDVVLCRPLEWRHVDPPLVLQVAFLHVVMRLGVAAGRDVGVPEADE